MGKFIKYLLFLAGGLAVLVLAAVLIVPKLIDVQKYTPLIEEKAAALTGRPVTLGGELSLSLFPWVGVSVSDFRLGNPEGFEGKDFIVVKSFEAHVKVMPLLSKEVQVDSFVLDGPEIYLEKRKDGRGNWEGLGSAAAKEPAKKEPAPKSEAGEFALKSIEVGEFSILKGRIRYTDRQQGMAKEISDLTLQLRDVSLERPVELSFSAVLDGKAVTMNGKLGPIGPNPGQGTLPIDLTCTLAEQLAAKITGQVDNPVGALSYNLALDVTQFSPRKLMRALGMEFPVVTSDPAALDAVALGMNVTGGTSNVAISHGNLRLDDSKIDFSGNAKAFSPLNLVFAGSLDAIDLDRYLPPKEQQVKESAGEGAGTTAQSTAQKIDYEPLRKLVLDTKFTIGELKVQGGRMENIQMHLTAQNGIFRLSPLSMDLYQGNISSAATVNVQAKAPVTSIDVKAANVQAGPLLKDFTKKDALEGTLVSDVSLTTRGDTPEIIKNNLNGKGELLFTDGAIVGIDLAGMVRNVQASFGLADSSGEKPRTDFAELRAPFTLKNGLFSTPETSLQSPLIRVTAAGTANLVTEALDMKVRPKFVATLKGQGDTAERSGLMVPVLIKGTFTSPKFSPDLTALLEGQLPDAEAIKKALEQEINPDKTAPQDQVESLEQGLKNLIPKFQFK